MKQTKTGKTYMIADTHFGDDNAILRYEGRPFNSGAEMTEAMIRAWNRVVTPLDTVYHLGDFASGLPFADMKAIVERLNGRKILIMGNHDRNLTPKEWLEMGFEEVYPLPVIFKEFYMLSHEPMYVNRASPYANIFGHVHGNPAYRDVSARSFCACVERTNYEPVSFEKICEAIVEADKKQGV